MIFFTVRIDIIFFIFAESRNCMVIDLTSHAIANKIKKLKIAKYSIKFSSAEPLFSIMLIIYPSKIIIPS